MTTNPFVPPKKDSTPTPARLEAMRDWLESITCFRPLTQNRPWFFYEEMERYFGPWGEKGYPIGYGKKYCVLFYTNHTLNTSRAGRQWVERTLNLLQVALKDFILSRYAEGTLAKLSSDEFTQAAFDSHPKAYTGAGLTMVVLLAPSLGFEIAWIPRIEFLPWADHFGPTILQVFETAAIAMPLTLGTLLAGVGPAHTGLYPRGGMSGFRELQAYQRQANEFGAMAEAVRGGNCDHVGALERIQKRIILLTVSDRGFGRTSADLLEAIESRKTFVMRRYRQEISSDQSLSLPFRTFDPAACGY